MFRAALRNVDLFWLILFYCVFLPESGCGSADVDSCHEVKTAYMMRQIGPVELVPDRPGAGQSAPSGKCHCRDSTWEAGNYERACLRGVNDRMV